jgi:nucleotide-binding universal stress UspA family protein
MKILVGYNGSSESQAALALAGDYAMQLGGHVMVVTSTEGGKGERPEDIAQAEAHLSEVKAMMNSQSITTEVFQTARGMSPGEDLVRLATEQAVDLIIVGVEKRSRAQKLLLGSTAQYVILKAPCPVLSTK